MKSDGPMKHFILAFVLAVACYAVFYWSIENRRNRKGPWQVIFTNTPAGASALVISQPHLGIANARIVFQDEPVPASSSLGPMVFSQPKPVPYDVPFGKCVFMDTTFLPGTVTFQLFGHEIELIPRVLILDHQEHPWLSESTMTLHPIRDLPKTNGVTN